MTKPRLLISIPTSPNGSLNHRLVSFLMEAQKMEEAEVSVHIIGARPTAEGRNMQVRHFLWETDAELMLCIDDDMIPGMDGLRLMLKHIAREDVDVVSAITLRSGKSGPQPVLLEMTRDLSGSKLNMEILSQPPGMHEVERGIIPGACFLGTRAAYERIHEARRPWFKDVLHDGSWEHYELKTLADQYAQRPESLHAEVCRRMYRDTDFHRKRIGLREWGHDAYFSRTCHELGVRVWVDTSIYWGHIKATDLRHLMQLLGEVKAAKEKAG